MPVGPAQEDARIADPLEALERCLAAAGQLVALSKGHAGIAGAVAPKARMRQDRVVAVEPRDSECVASHRPCLADPRLVRHAFDRRQERTERQPRGLRRARAITPLVFGILLGAACAGAQVQPIAPEAAGDHLGEVVTVEGNVETVICSPLACLVSFTADYSGLAASIPGDVVSRFPSPKETYANRRVRVRGTVVDRNGRPRIEVTDPEALLVVGAAGGAAPGSGAAPVVRVNRPAGVDPAGASPQQVTDGAVVAAAEALGAPAADDPSGDAATASRSRVIAPGVVTTRSGGPRPPSAEPSGDGLVARLERGAADVAAVESRSLEQRVEQLQQENASLAEVVQELEERLAVLERTGGRGQGVNEAELPYTPEYVVSGEKSTRLEAVKRGWSSERLLRAVGPPLNTVTEANGYMTWYYANGRAVTLDPRGRVASSVGF